MIKIELKPLQGIEIESVGQILFNQSQSEIVKALGKPSTHSTNTQLFFNQYELRIDFDEQGASFIEFIHGPYLERTELVIYGVNPFSVGGVELVELLTFKNAGAVDDTEAEYSYGFLNISVGIWRQATETDIQAAIDECKQDGTSIDQIRELEEELQAVKNFWTIGLGRSGYYDNAQLMP